VFYFVFVLWLFSDESRGTVFFVFTDFVIPLQPIFESREWDFPVINR
jgi:hypothetical protein